MSFSPLGPQSPVNGSFHSPTTTSRRSASLQAYSIPEEPPYMPASANAQRKLGHTSGSSSSSSTATSPHNLYHQHHHHSSTGNAQLASPVSPSKRSSLKGASYGSTSSLMSFDDPSNPMHKKYTQPPNDATLVNPQHQQHSRNLSSGSAVNPLSTSVLPANSPRLHYNPHTCPRLQSISQNPAPVSDQSINNPPYLPYSPITSTSPATPKRDPTYNPWASPRGTPTLRLSPGRQKGPPVPLSLQPPVPQDHASKMAARSASLQQPSNDYPITSPVRSHNNSAQSRPHPAMTTQQPRHASPQLTSVPSFRRITSKSELNPVINPHPKYRRALPEGGSLSPLAALTTQLPTTYRICNPAFNYQSSKNPRRILTKPGEGKLNNGYDNADNDYILYVNDILGIDEQRRYLVLDILGQGTFGQVVKCQNMVTKEIVAVKVIKNKPAYLKQSMMEVSILDHLNNQVDRGDEHNLLRLKDRFMHKSHLCLVFEILSSNLYELIKRNNFRGLSINLVRVFAQQLLDSLKVLKDAKLIHCDLKPENILLRSLDSPTIKVIDFGSACHELQTVYTYIQSRFYRSPEVLLGLPYTTSIDMWSLGCIVAELFLGLPIFPGTSEYNQLSRIIDTLGVPPNWMVEMGKTSAQFMEKVVDDHGRKHYRLKSREKFSAEMKTEEQPSKMYFPSTKLNEIIMNYPLPKPNMSKAEVDLEMQNRASFVDFVKGLLNMNPFERWTPHQAAMHPFITESKFVAPFKPALGSKEKSSTQGKYEPSHQHAPVQQQLQHQQPQQQFQHQQQQHSAHAHAQHQPQQQQQVAQHKPQQPVQHRSVKVEPQVKPRSQNYYGTSAYETPHIQGAPASGYKGYAPSTTTQGTASSSQQHSTAWSTRRQRASTIGNMGPIPPHIQRATAMMNPEQLIRAQPSPAYIPPPELTDPASAGRHSGGKGSNGRNSGSGDVVRHLEAGLNAYWN